MSLDIGASVLMLLTNGFRPDPRVAKEAAALVQEGYGVTVLAWDREYSFPCGEMHQGAEIIRLRTGKVGSTLSFLINYPVFLVRALLAALRRDDNIIHSHDLDTLPVGYMISWLKRIPLVFDAHENYPKMISMDAPTLVSRLATWLEGILTRRAELVITVSETHAAHMRPNARHGVILVENCIDIPEDIGMPEPEGKGLRLLYVGSLEPMRYILESIGISRRMEGCIYELAGWGRLEQEVRRQADGETVCFSGFLQHSDMLRKMASSDVVVCLLDSSNENYVGNSPTKIYEAMAVGVPVITTSGTTSGDLVSREGCGLVIDWSEDNFLHAMDLLRDPELRRKLGRAGRAAAEREYNWENMKRRLLDGYSGLLDILRDR